MNEALYGFLGALGSGFLGGIVSGLGLRWGIVRRCYRLELSLMDMQKYLLSVKGKQGADARWGKADRDAAEVMAMKPMATRQERFANDSFNMDEMNGLSR